MSSQFEQLKTQLEEQDWPAVYFFKFISPSDSETIAKVTSLFGSDADLKMRSSRKGNYISISIKEVMLNTAEVIKVYEKAAKIKGVISL